MQQTKLPICEDYAPEKKSH